MIKASSPDLILKFSDFLAEMTGLYFPPESSKDFAKKLQPVVKAFGFEDLSECLEWLMKSPLNKKQIEVLAYHLTIGETYFFRDQKAFSILEAEILPQIIEKHQKDKQIRIWSAASCTGEEPYSIAILLSRLISDIKNWKITILGTDINHSFLLKAENALYKQWSFRATSKEILDQYFLKNTEGNYALLPQIKQLVKFSYLNLVEDTYPDEQNNTANIDLILCNNVLIYFSKKQINKVIHQLSKSLVEGGYLLVSPIESPYVKEYNLIPVTYDRYIIFKKSNRPQEQRPKGSFNENLEEISSKKSNDSEKVLLTIELPSFLKLDQPTLQFHFGNPFVEEKSSAFIEEEKKIADVKPKKSEVQKNDLINEIHSLADSGLLQKAKEKSEEALALDKVDPLLHFLHATILQSMQELDEAVKALKRAIFLEDTFAYAHFVLGNILKKQGKNLESKREFQNAARILKKFPADTIILGTENLTAEHLLKIINSIEAKDK